MRGLGDEIVIHDPCVPPHQGDLRERLRGCDAAVLMVAHDENHYMNSAEMNVLVVDAKQI
jgi:UDP-N-acetyl-D-mannosaminuronate dehydrogenase